MSCYLFFQRRGDNWCDTLTSEWELYWEQAVVIDLVHANGAQQQ